MVPRSGCPLCMELKPSGGAVADAALLPLASGVISWSRRNALRFPALEDCTTPPTSDSSTNTITCLKSSTPCPKGRSWPHLRKAYEHQFLNRIVRIRRRLGLPTPEPPAKRWYRTSDTALFLGVSTKSVLRWTATGFLRCERAGDRAHRYYAHEELLRVQRRLEDMKPVPDLPTDSMCLESGR